MGLSTVSKQRRRVRRKLVRELLQFWGADCILCGQKFSVTDPPTIEHIRPKSLGGTNYRDNLALAHELCNAVRGNAPFTSAALLISSYKGTPGWRKRLTRALELKMVKAS